MVPAGKVKLANMFSLRNRELLKAMVDFKRKSLKKNFLI